jgi:hypothetical protein
MLLRRSHGTWMGSLLRRAKLPCAMYKCPQESSSLMLQHTQLVATCCIKDSWPAAVTASAAAPSIARSHVLWLLLLHTALRAWMAKFCNRWTAATGGLLENQQLHIAAATAATRMLHAASLLPLLLCVCC